MVGVLGFDGLYFLAYLLDVYVEELQVCDFVVTFGHIEMVFTISLATPPSITTSRTCFDCGGSYQYQQ